MHAGDFRRKFKSERGPQMGKKTPIKPNLLPSAVPAAPSHHPPRQQIATLAYLIFLARGSEDGHDLDDWLQAEQELVNQAKATPLHRGTAA
jgi:Protein of unknown function (DUF2934)